jgi:RHS repeat-associated protein
LISPKIKYDYFQSAKLPCGNYNPFGMQMPGRKSGNQDYRFSFQGQEKDDEIKGQGNSLNYEYRMHDPRIGRFFARDPLAAKYAYNSPYAFSENRVIDAFELEGLEKLIIHLMQEGKDGNLALNMTKSVTVIEDTYIIYANTLGDAVELLDGVTQDFHLQNNSEMSFEKISLLAHGIPYGGSSVSIEINPQYYHYGGGDGTINDFDLQHGTDDANRIHQIFNLIQENGEIWMLSCQLGRDEDMVNALSQMVTTTGVYMYFSTTNITATLIKADLTYKDSETGDILNNAQYYWMAKDNGDFFKVDRDGNRTDITFNKYEVSGRYLQTLITNEDLTKIILVSKALSTIF